MAAVALPSIERFPSAQFPAQLAQWEVGVLEVAILVKPRVEGAPKMVLSPRPGEIDLKVLVIVRPGTFELLGDPYSLVTVPVKELDSGVAHFELRAREAGEQKVTIDFLCEGAYVGQLEVRTLVTPGAVVGTAQVTNTSTNLTFVPSNEPPDLSVLITEERSDSGVCFRISMTADGSGIPYFNAGPLNFHDPKEKMNQLFREIESKGQGATPESLEAKGQDLWSSLPEPFVTKFWSIRKNIRTIQIISDEPYIPWEMLKPWRQTDGAVEVQGFLCEDYVISRWLSSKNYHPKNSVASATLVVPRDPRLPSAQNEKTWVEEFLQRKNIAVSAAGSLADVRGILEKGGFDLLHVSSHGQKNEIDPDQGRVLLEAGGELHPEDITGRWARFGAERPLVFLNACQTAAEGFALTALGGWAAKFLDAGATAFIGTTWSVYDSTALEFAKEFYTRLDAGETIGEAVRDARRACKRLGNPTWLAYQLYAHPNSHIRFSSPSG